MTGFVMRPRILEPNWDRGDLDDTENALEESERACSLYRYVHGHTYANFPVPAITTSVGYGPEHWSQMYPSAYWYITTPDVCISFWERWGNCTKETR